VLPEQCTLSTNKSFFSAVDEVGYWKLCLQWTVGLVTLLCNTIVSLNTGSGKLQSVFWLLLPWWYVLARGPTVLKVTVPESLVWYSQYFLFLLLYHFLYVADYICSGSGQSFNWQTQGRVRVRDRVSVDSVITQLGWSWGQILSLPCLCLVTISWTRLIDWPLLAS
jgi:hypothetical protein